MIRQPLPDEWRTIRVEMISPRPANNAGAQWREMQLFVSITKTEKQSRSDSQAVTALRKYDGGGERARGLVGAEVVKPTYTQFIQRFQLTLIIAVDESARFLHLSNFAAGDTCFCVNESEPDQGQNHSAASCFPTKWGVTAKLEAGLTGGEGSDWISCHPTTLKANLKAADLSECIQTDIRERLKYGENLSEIFD